MRNASRGWSSISPYPDDCGTLQECIDDSPCNGGVVEIADDLPILDPIQFEKGLTLRAAPGHKPLLLATLTADGSATSDVDIVANRISGMGYSWGLSAYSAGSATVRIAENLGTGQIRPDPSDDSASYAAISLYSDGGSGTPSQARAGRWRLVTARVRPRLQGEAGAAHLFASPRLPADTTLECRRQIL